MGKKKQLTIKLITVPNGYTLDMTMDGISQGYMYFTLNELLEGFMYHVGLKEIGVINKDEINIFLTAITKWQDNKQLIVEKIQNEAEIAQLKERVCQLSEQGKEKTERLAEQNKSDNQIICEEKS